MNARSAFFRTIRHAINTISSSNKEAMPQLSGRHVINRPTNSLTTHSTEEFTNNSHGLGIPVEDVCGVQPPRRRAKDKGQRTRTKDKGQGPGCKNTMGAGLNLLYFMCLQGLWVTRVWGPKGFWGTKAWGTKVRKGGDTRALCDSICCIFRVWRC